MTSLATADDYQTRTGETLDVTGIAQVTLLLQEASALIRREAPGIDAAILANTMDPVLVTGICCRVVQRYLANPTQATQLGTGPFIEGYAAATATGLALTAAEKGQLTPTPLVAGVPAGIGTIRVGTVVRPREFRCGWGR